jgi:hypothetical protein
MLLHHKICTGSSNNNKEIFSLVSNDLIDPLAFKEAVKHEE